MELRLNPPAQFVLDNNKVLDRIEGDYACGKANLPKAKLDKLEKDIESMVTRWKEGTSQLRTRLQEYNDMMEGVTEETDFPWVGASSVTMGVAAGMARTLKATMNRALFSDERFLIGEAISATKRNDLAKLEEAVNWLTSKANNFLDTLKDIPIPLFRDGTVPVMGEWERTVEQAVDYKVYQDTKTFQADYPTPDDAGMDDKKYAKTLKYLDKEYNPDLQVEYVYDATIYDAPKFTMVPLARFCFFPLSAESLQACVLYGRQFFEGEEEARTKAKFGEYDQEPTDEAIGKVKGMVDDTWGYEREKIEGLSSGADDYKRLECYRLVLKKDLDGDKIPEKYIITYEHTSKRILSIRRYPLRKNIDNMVLFRFLKRDGRLLGVSLMGDGMDQFKLIDDLHRHRQNVRAITDAPAFIVPESLKDEVDFGSSDYVWRPGVTIYLPDNLIGKAEPKQMVVQNLDNTNNGLDEEGGVMRYLEIRLGPSQGMSGKEALNDPKQPATKTLALLRQSTFRLDDYASELKRSVPPLVKLHNALYYQYGPRSVKYMAQVGESSVEMECEQALFRSDTSEFSLRCSEMALSPEYQIEKAHAILQAIAGAPVLLQMKPEILVNAWNELIYAIRPSDPDKFLIQQTPAGAQLPPALGGGMMAPGGAPQAGAVDPGQAVNAMQLALSGMKGGGSNGIKASQRG